MRTGVLSMAQKGMTVEEGREALKRAAESRHKFDLVGPGEDIADFDRMIRSDPEPATPVNPRELAERAVNKVLSGAIDPKTLGMLKR